MLIKERSRKLKENNNLKLPPESNLNHTFLLVRWTISRSVIVSGLEERRVRHLVPTKNDISEQMPHLYKILLIYKRDDTWNTDVFSLFYRQPLTWNLCNKSRAWFKLEKMKVTILACFNSIGPETFPQMVINRA